MSNMSSNITYHDIDGQCLLCHIILPMMILIALSMSTMSSNITYKDIDNTVNVYYVI